MGVARDTAHKSQFVYKYFTYIKLPNFYRSANGTVSDLQKNNKNIKYV